MAGDGGGDSPSRINRREALKRTAIATGVAWSAPILTSIRTPAFAQYGVPCEEGCFYVAVITHRNGVFTCSECTGSEGPCSECVFEDCAGPACPRITSITDDGTNVTVCVDCDLGGGSGGYCHRCLDTGECTCSGDPAAVGNCIQMRRLFDCAADEQWDVVWSCEAC
jgi:hypothetical protein